MIYIKIIIDSLLKTAFTENNRNVYAFMLCFRFYYYIDSRFVVFCDNIYISCCTAHSRFSVCPYVISPLRSLMQTGYLLKQLFLYRIHIIIVPLTCIITIKEKGTFPSFPFIFTSFSVSVLHVPG